MKPAVTILALFIASTTVAQGLINLIPSHPNNTSSKAIQTERTESVAGDSVQAALAASTILDTFSYTKLRLHNANDKLHSSGNERHFSNVSTPLAPSSRLYLGPSHQVDSLPESSQGVAEDSIAPDERQVAFDIYAIPAEEEIMIEGVSYMAELTVYDLKGNKREPTPSYTYHRGMRLNIHRLQSGIYVLHIKDEEVNKMMKLVKK